MADYCIIYDTATGRLKAMLAETDQLAAGALAATTSGRAIMADGFIVSAKLGSGQLGSLHIAPAAIISSLIASGALGRNHILNSEIVSALIASGQIGSLHVAPAAIVSALIASGQLGTNHFASGAVCSETECDTKIAARVPSGLIVLWHGTIANIPAGYVICDGENSTPNLLTKFVQGVATAATDPGATGGATAKTTAGHNHTNTVGGDKSADNISTKAGGGLASCSPGGCVVAQSIGTKTDSITDIRPLFYDVAFLMKT